MYVIVSVTKTSPAHPVPKLKCGHRGQVRVITEAHSTRQHLTINAHNMLNIGLRRRDSVDLRPILP